MSARRIFSILFLLACVAGALWMRSWMAKRPLSMSGGLYFPVAVEIPGPHFLQGDPRWGSDRLAQTDDSLAEAGCAVASAAMALASRGVDTDPGRLNAFLQKMDGGYTPEGWIYWEKAAEIDSKRVGTLLPHYEDAPSHFLIDWNLLRGNPVIARVRYPSGLTHFVVICGKRGFEYILRDPGEAGMAGPTLLSDLPPPVEALRFYRVD
ncbi:MAG: hypothetical protein ACKOEZ_03650 [Spartobacteria bacterium]